MNGRKRGQGRGRNKGVLLTHSTLKVEIPRATVYISSSGYFTWLKLLVSSNFHYCDCLLVHLLHTALIHKCKLMDNCPQGGVARACTLQCKSINSLSVQYCLLQISCYLRTTIIYGYKF